MESPDKKPEVKLQLSYRDLVTGTIFAVMLGTIIYQKVEIASLRTSNDLADKLETIESNEDVVKKLASNEEQINSLGGLLKEQKQQCEKEVAGLKTLMGIYKNDVSRLEKQKATQGYDVGYQKGFEAGQKAKGEEGVAEVKGSKGKSQNGNDKGRGQTASGTQPMTAHEVVMKKWEMLHEKSHKRIKNGSCPFCYSREKNRFNQDVSEHEHAEKTNVGNVNVSTVNVTKVETGRVSVEPVKVSPVPSRYNTETSNAIVSTSHSKQKRGNSRYKTKRSRSPSSSVSALENILNNARNTFSIPILEKKQKEMDLE